jgi:hypothetical protein
MPQTHLGIAGDGERFIYAVGGQLGPQCRPAVADGFVLDVRSRSWATLPPLPEPRYGPAAQFWNGRLHVMSGSRPDRGTPAVEHWSLGVAGGRAVEPAWREETPLPRGGPHRASAVVGNRLLLFGGQEGDVLPLPDAPGCVCDWSTPFETVYADTFATTRRGGPWTAVSPMPVALSHTEHGVAAIGRYAALVGGNERRDRLCDLILVYDTEADRWWTAGRLPYVMRTAAVYHEGWLYLLTGQRGGPGGDARPGEFLNGVWRARFDPRLPAEAAAAPRPVS